MKRLRNGENGAMKEFVCQYAPCLKGICTRYVSSKEDAKDVFQNALVRIVTKIADFKYQGAGSLQSWASRIVINESIRFLQDHRRHEFAKLDLDVADEPEEDDPPIDLIPPEVIHRMVSELPIGYRTVFNLYVFEDKSHEEIASLLGISPKTSSSQLCRAKNLLAKMITAYNHQNKQPR